MNHGITMPGGALKAAGVFADNGKLYGKAEGYAILWGDENTRDLAGDWFTKATYLGPQNGDGCEHVFHHSIAIKGFEDRRDHVFAPWKTAPDDIGLFAQTVYDLSDAYEEAVYGLVMAGKIGLSSATSPHRMRRKGDTPTKAVECGEITCWPILEISDTFGPCDPRLKGELTAVKAANLKALVEIGGEAFDVPDAVAAELARLKEAAMTEAEAPEVEAEAESEVNRLANEIARRVLGLQLAGLQFAYAAMCCDD